MTLTTPTTPVPRAIIGLAETAWRAATQSPSLGLNAYHLAEALIGSAEAEIMASGATDIPTTEAVSAALINAFPGDTIATDDVAIKAALDSGRATETQIAHFARTLGRSLAVENALADGIPGPLDEPIARPSDDAISDLWDSAVGTRFSSSRFTYRDLYEHLMNAARLEAARLAPRGVIHAQAEIVDRLTSLSDGVLTDIWEDHIDPTKRVDLGDMKRFALALRLHLSTYVPPARPAPLAFAYATPTSESLLAAIGFDIPAPDVLASYWPLQRLDEPAESRTPAPGSLSLGKAAQRAIEIARETPRPAGVSLDEWQADLVEAIARIPGDEGSFAHVRAAFGDKMPAHEVAAYLEHLAIYFHSPQAGAYIGGYGASSASLPFHAAECATLWERANRLESRWDHEKLRRFTGRLLEEASLRTGSGGFEAGPGNRIVVPQLQDLPDETLKRLWVEVGGTEHMRERELRRYAFLVSLQAAAHAGSGDTEMPQGTPETPDAALLEWLWLNGVHDRHIPEQRDLLRLVDGMLDVATRAASVGASAPSRAAVLGNLRTHGHEHANRVWLNLDGIPYNMPNFELWHFADALSLYLDATIPVMPDVADPRQVIESVLRDEAPQLDAQTVARLVDRLANLD